jgi:hypothetical protein
MKRLLDSVKRRFEPQTWRAFWRQVMEGGPLPITEARAEKQGVWTSVFWTSVWASGTCADYLGNLKSRRSG